MMDMDPVDRPFRSVSYNIYSGAYSPTDSRCQDYRVGQISDAINKAAEAPNSVAVFLCEISSEQNFERIASETDLSIVTQPYRVGRHELLGFLATEDIASSSSARHVAVDTERYGDDYGFLQLRDISGGISIVGAHPSRKLIEHQLMRELTFAKMLRVNAKFKRAIIEGDFNTPHGFPARRKLRERGYESALGPFGALFPTAGYRGNTVPLWFPPVTIDGIYAKGLAKTRSGQVRSRGSDHPLVWADYVFKQKKA